MAEEPPLKSKFKAVLLKTVLFNDPVRLICGNCKKYIPGNMDWVCGHCGEEHRNVRLYTFLYKCRRCHEQPQSFECPNCNAIWCIEENGNADHPARPIRVKVVEPPAESEKAKRKREHIERMEEYDMQISEAKKLAQLEEAKGKGAAPTPKKTPEELRREEIINRVRRLLADKKSLKEAEKILLEERTGDEEACEEVRAAVATVKDDLAL